ncbi:glycoside hydrolase [candidate division KSB1 bacterium]|nr:glycoside hydrolase [candidate division KSB1 bacterium]
MRSPLHIAFLWHMHQPYYWDPFTEKYRLPWVRLHGVKDYYDMVAILKDFPDIRVTFNLVPSLLDQLEGYVLGITDPFLDITLKSDYDGDDRLFLLKNYFALNIPRMVRPYQRYWRLFQLRGGGSGINRGFKDQEFRDIAVWFNLAWCGHTLRITDSVRGLLQKGRNFTHRDKELLISEQNRLIEKIIPTYQEFAHQGQIEITTSPYYHPILPLLIDTGLARQVDPALNLPQHSFNRPEDARWQIGAAAEAYQRCFGIPPRGLWPSEGSLCRQAIPMMADAGFHWTATDAEILRRSLGKGRLAPKELYRPYRITVDGGELVVFFRDSTLSDLIGFTYAGWDSVRAADDFVHRLAAIREGLPDDGRSYVISIILDGENAWEHYPNNGWDFLTSLYGKLQQSTRFKTVTFSEFLKGEERPEELSRIVPGSWINGNFDTWIGQPEKNRAWDLLAGARTGVGRSLIEGDGGAPEGLHQIYIAEGSDWFWWLGEGQYSLYENEFDSLFRNHLKKAYSLIGRPIPATLEEPLTRGKAMGVFVPPTHLISPGVNGASDLYYDWTAAGYCQAREGAIHRTYRLLKKLYFGFDLENLYLKLILDRPRLEALRDNPALEFKFYRPVRGRLRVTLFRDGYKLIFVLDDREKEIPTTNFSMTKSLKIRLPFVVLGARAGDPVEFYLSLTINDNEVERLPGDELIDLVVPSEEFEGENWYV